MSHGSGGCDQAAGTVGPLVESSSRFTHGHRLRSHVAERESSGPFISLQVSALATFSKPNYLPRVSSPDTTTLGTRMSTCDSSQEDTTVPSIADVVE